MDHFRNGILVKITMKIEAKPVFAMEIVL